MSELQKATSDAHTLACTHTLGSEMDSLTCVTGDLTKHGFNPKSSKHAGINATPHMSTEMRRHIRT